MIKKQNNLVNKLIDEAESLLDSDKKEAGLKLLVASKGAPRNKKLIKIMQQEGIKQLCFQIESEYIRDKRTAEIDDQLFFTIDERSNITDLCDKGRAELSPENPEDFVIPDLGEIFHDVDNEKIDSKEKMIKKAKAQILHSERSDQIHN